MSVLILFYLLFPPENCKISRNDNQLDLEKNGKRGCDVKKERKKITKMLRHLKR